jgi:hypothetical protein
MDANEKEARIGLAIQGYKHGQLKTPAAAAEAFDMSKDSLHRCLWGTPAQQGAIAVTHLLTLIRRMPLCRESY